MADCVLRRFDTPDETRTFERGRLDLVRIARTTLGRARYEPGWKWSEHVAPVVGTRSCQVAHLGLVLEGRAMVRMDDGEEFELKPGDIFQLPRAYTVQAKDNYFPIEIEKPRDRRSP